MTNQIAANINAKIYEQDDKLDEISKKNMNSLNNIKNATGELRQAEAASNRNCKCIAYLTLMALVLVAVLSASVFMLFFN